MKIRNPRGQLGRAMTILYEANAAEEIMHQDGAAFGAPSECHALVSKGEAQRMRHAYRRACAVSGLKRREFVAIFNAMPQHIWHRANAQVLARLSPFG